jgi:hypothetical protein
LALQHRALQGTEDNVHSRIVITENGLGPKSVKCAP